MHVVVRGVDITVVATWGAIASALSLTGGCTMIGASRAAPARDACYTAATSRWCYSRGVLCLCGCWCGWSAAVWVLVCCSFAMAALFIKHRSRINTLWNRILMQLSCMVRCGCPPPFYLPPRRSHPVVARVATLPWGEGSPLLPLRAPVHPRRHHRDAHRGAARERGRVGADEPSPVHGTGAWWPQRVQCDCASQLGVRVC